MATFAFGDADDDDDEEEDSVAIFLLEDIV